MRTIRVKRFFHEFFGEETTKLDLLLVLLASILGTTMVFGFDDENMMTLSLPSLILVLILMFDIFGGVVANMTKGTSSYYRERPSLRQIFILVHIQPILFALFIGNHLLESIFVYIYVLLSSTLVNASRHYPVHKALGAMLFMFGAITLLIFGQAMAPYVQIFFIFYMMKLIVSFSITHAHVRKTG